MIVLSPSVQTSQDEKEEITEGSDMRLCEDGLAVSEEEYWEKYYNHPDFKYEWNNGYLEVKPMADHRSSLMYQWFSDILRSYFSTYPIGKIVNLEIGFRLAIPHKNSVRMPDMAVVLDNNSIVINPEDCRYWGVFDLCIESLSYSSLKEIRRDTVAKKSEYEGMGVKEYYILDARGKETAFFRAGKKGKYSHIKPVNGDIIRSGVLEGFQFRISDLYSQPSLKELSGDAVYKEYVLPFYQDAKKEAEQEKQRAEQEKQRADGLEQQLKAERQKAEQLAAKLKLLGISLE